MSRRCIAGHAYDTLTFDVLEAEATDDGSLERARKEPVELVYDHAGDAFLVAFESSDHVHEVELHRAPDSWRADCWKLDDEGHRIGRCRGWIHHDGPCAHLSCRSHIAHQKIADDERRHDLDVEQAVADGGQEGRR